MWGTCIRRLDAFDLTNNVLRFTSVASLTVIGVNSDNISGVFEVFAGSNEISI